MDKKILKKIIGSENLFVPLIFTKKQMFVIKKHFLNRKLSNAEKKSLYTSVTKKVSAIASLINADASKEFYINNAAKILPERLDAAKKLLFVYAKNTKYLQYSKIFISGSFLFSKEFNDIDIFMIRERGYKEIHEGNKHIIFLPEKKLSQPTFQSASLISISNFLIPTRMIKKRLSLKKLMSLYHESVIEFLQNEKKPEMIRNLIFSHALFCKNKLLDGMEIKEITSSMTLESLDEMLKQLCKKLFSKLYLYVELHDYIKTLGASIKNIHQNHHLIRYKNTYEELIYAGKRSAAKTA